VLKNGAILLLLLTIAIALSTRAAEVADARGIQFIGFDRFDRFAAATNSATGERTLTSPIVSTHLRWNELVASWNAVTTNGTGLMIEARVFHGERPTKFFNLGHWASQPAKHPRESIPAQKDDDGDVQTDTLILTHPATNLQLRITLRGGPSWPELKFLAVSLLDNRIVPAPLAPVSAAWGVDLPVPKRSQLHYPGGDAWCSPTVVSMLLGFWADKLRRPELDVLPPAVADAIHDPKWEGTGNWSFNMAFAGSLPGMRAMAVRLSDLAEVEEWVARGFPVGLSICSNRLNDRGRKPRGHLVVCVGFTDRGDAILHDPGRSKEIHRVVPRERLADAWAYSKNTAYLVFPEDAHLPEDRFGHWALKARQE
jgi:hypothetical protein